MTALFTDLGLLFPWAFWGLVVIIPVVLLYLLRPQPKELRIPSVMFISQMEQKRRFNSFFKKIIRDPLLVLQILAIIVICIAAVAPFILRDEISTAQKEIVVIVDSSSSMNSVGGGTRRFDKAKSEAMNTVSSLLPGDRATIIVAENMPIVLARQASPEAALSAIDSINPKSTPSAVGTAISLASDIIEDSGAKRQIYVFSDFGPQQGEGPEAAKKAAESKGTDVIMRTINNGENNIGIVSSQAGRNDDGCYIDIIVMNFGKNKETVSASPFLGETPYGLSSRDIEPNATESFSFVVPCSSSAHELSVKIDPGGDLSDDDIAFASIPEISEIKVLLIKEKDDNEHVRYALDAIHGVEVEETNPPIYPQQYNSYDIVIFQSARPQNILGGTFAELGDFVEKGGNLVVLASPYLPETSMEMFAERLPIVPLSVKDSQSKVSLSVKHRITTDVDFPEIVIKKSIEAASDGRAAIIASAENNPIIAIKSMGEGKSVYVGLSPDPEWSDFYMKPSFPVFWSNLLLWLKEGDAEESSRDYKTGTFFSIKNSTINVRYPSGKVLTTGSVLLDEIGFYKLGEKAISASLLDFEESDISASSLVSSSVIVDEGLVGDEKEIESTWNLFWIFAIIALLLVTWEWFIVKDRGDI